LSVCFFFCALCDWCFLKAAYLCCCCCPVHSLVTSSSLPPSLLCQAGVGGTRERGKEGCKRAFASSFVLWRRRRLGLTEQKVACQVQDDRVAWIKQWATTASDLLLKILLLLFHSPSSFFMFLTSFSCCCCYCCCYCCCCYYY
jgi:hypothetical protein